MGGTFVNNASITKSKLTKQQYTNRNCKTKDTIGCKEKREIVVRPCTIDLSSQHTYVQAGLCLDFKDGYSPKIQGAFEDPIYTYISVTVMPCHLS